MTILLEVKRRISDLIQGLFQPPIIGADGQLAIEPTHDCNLLFRSVAHKFPIRETNEVIHAVWVNTGYRQEQRELEMAFGRLPAPNIQVAVLGDWQSDAFVLASDQAAKQAVIETLQLTESKRFVFTRGMEPEA